MTEVRSDQTPRRYVAELQGLRGLALVLVVLFHLFGQGRVSGGVDVFLVVSAFLSTLIVMDHLGRGTFGPGRQVGRTLWRLTPSALLVLTAIALLTVVVLPATRWPTIADQIAASALGLENWALIDAGLAYGAVGPAANPLQHFWSLSIQLQFLLLWPIVLFALHRLALRIGSPPVRVVGSVVAVATVASFVWAAVRTVLDQDVAYYSSFTRFWELGAGAALALLYPRLRLGPRLGGLLVVGGLILLITCGFVLDGARLFPGPWALWPVLAAGLVIVGAAGGSTLARRLLDNEPWRIVAQHSYALYLWHWPIMVFYLAWRTHPELGTKGATAVLAVSCALAWATTRFLERPLRSVGQRVAPRRAVVIAALASLVVAVGGLGATASIERQVDGELVQASDRAVHPGGGNLALAAGASTDVPRPSPQIAAFDRPTDDDCSQTHLEAPRYDAVVRCPVTTAPEGSPTVMLVGGSHVEQWIPTVASLADRNGWTVTALVKQGCRLSVVEPAPTKRPSCARWSENAMAVLRAERPDLVLVMGTWTAWTEPERAPSIGQAQAWDELVKAGTDVVALRDTPRFEQSVPECLLEHDAATCTKPREAVYGDWAALQVNTAAHQLDLSDLFCTDVDCPPVIGNVVAYRDQDHMTATYARTLDDALEQRLAALGLGVFDSIDPRAADFEAESAD
jgi:peptidoglycan/LPS O-acetylase OafA/YrhL